MYSEVMFDFPYALTFNCFYTIFGESLLTQFPLQEILLNIAFNAGYMYDDVKNVVVYFTGDVTDDTWTLIGNKIGDFFIRFLFREDLGPIFAD